MMKQRSQFGLATSGSRRHKKLRERFDTMHQWFSTRASRHPRGCQ